MRCAALLPLVLPLLLACSSAETPSGAGGQAEPRGSSAPNPPAPHQVSSPSATPTATPPPAGAKAGVEGSWKSPSCGARKYLRRLEVRAGGAFESSDLVSPCPPQVPCFWSGIVNRKGTWKLAGTSLQLSPEGPAQSAGQALPASLAWDAGASQLTELDGDTKCPYTHGGP